MIRLYNRGGREVKEQQTKGEERMRAEYKDKTMVLLLIDSISVVWSSTDCLLYSMVSELCIPKEPKGWNKTRFI